MNAILIGATGLTGQALLHELLNSNEFTQVIAIVRSKAKLEALVQKMGMSASKLSTVEFDFKSWEKLTVQLQAEAKTPIFGFCCLGTTIKVAGSKEEFYRVDVESVVNFARQMSAIGADKLVVISSQGASEQGFNYYLKCKGEMERRCAEIFSGSCVFIRPGLLLGDRQEHRPGEQAFAKLSQAVPFLFSGPLKKFKPIHVRAVAGAMKHFAISKQSFERIQFIENDVIHKFATIELFKH